MQGRYRVEKFVGAERGEGKTKRSNGHSSICLRTVVRLSNRGSHGSVLNAATG